MMGQRETRCACLDGGYGCLSLADCAKDGEGALQGRPGRKRALLREGLAGRKDVLDVITLGQPSARVRDPSRGSRGMGGKSRAGTMTREQADRAEQRESRELTLQRRGRDEE